MTNFSTVDPARRLVTTVCEGALTMDVIKADMERIRAHPGFLPTFDQLIDLSRATVALGPRETIVCSEIQLFDPSCRRAIVAPTDLAFGMARMFAAYREINGEKNLLICRTWSEAMDWLGGTGTTPATAASPSSDTAEFC